MADNYLENRMDDLRSGKLAPKVTHKRVLPLRGHYYFVENGASPERRNIVEELRRQGATVVFSGNDKTIASSLQNIYGAVPLDTLPPATGEPVKYLYTVYNQIFEIIN